MRRTAAHEIPLELACSDEFMAAWSDWLSYRQERRATCVPTTMRFQLRKLAEAGVADSVAMIHQSIERGWLGLFPVKQDRPDYSKPTPQDRVESRLAAFGDDWP